MNILTFDIEEWFHILDNHSTRTEKEWDRYERRLYANMERIFTLLEETNTRATFFCMGWIAREYPEVIRRIDEQGYELASHSDLHQLAFDQSQADFREDLARSIKTIEDLIGKKVRCYRAPGFSIGQSNQWAFETLLELGIEIDCSVFPAGRAHGGFADFGTAQPCMIEVAGARLKEFPINVQNLLGRKVIFSGGGYFRLFPYLAIKQFMRSSPYVMSYFHPRDFDPDQPMINELSAFRKFKSFYGLGRCYGKLKKLLGACPFQDIREADERVAWDEVPVIRLAGCLARV